MEPLVPPPRDKLPGKYWSFNWMPPVSRNGRKFAPSRWRRRVEGNILRRYVDGLLGKEPPDPYVDASDCQHGCNGDCLRSGSDRCNFTCHPELTSDYWE